MNKHDHGEYCSYCEGQGYYDLIVGGSETCPACQGSGSDGEK